MMVGYKFLKIRPTLSFYETFFLIKTLFSMPFLRIRKKGIENRKKGIENKGIIIFDRDFFFNLFAIINDPGWYFFKNEWM